MKHLRLMAATAVVLCVAAPAGSALGTTPPSEPAPPTTVDGAVPASAHAAWVEFAARYRATIDTDPAAGEGFVFEGTDYTVTMPGEPETLTQPAPTATGSTVEVLIHTAQNDDDIGFTVAEIDVPEGAPYSLEAGQQGAIDGISGTLIDSREIELDGVPGREFSASLESNGIEGTYVGRIYSDQQRVWQVAVVGPGSLSATDPVVAAFFDSFQFTGGS